MDVEENRAHVIAYDMMILRSSGVTRRQNVRRVPEEVSSGAEAGELCLNLRGPCPAARFLGVTKLQRREGVCELETPEDFPM